MHQVVGSAKWYLEASFWNGGNHYFYASAPTSLETSSLVSTDLVMCLHCLCDFSEYNCFLHLSLLPTFQFVTVCIPNTGVIAHVLSFKMAT